MADEKTLVDILADYLKKGKDEKDKEGTAFNTFLNSIAETKEFKDALQSSMKYYNDIGLKFKQIWADHNDLRDKMSELWTDELRRAASEAYKANYATIRGTEDNVEYGRRLRAIRMISRLASNLG